MVLQKMRAGAQGLAAKVVVGLIVFVLAVTGFGAIQFFSGGEPIVATVNGDDITQSRLELETQRQRTQRRAELGGEVPDEILDQFVNREAVLQSLIVSTLVVQLADELDLSISEQAIQARIREAFGGAGFDAAAYRNYLANMGHTPTSFQAELADSELRTQLSSSLGETSIVSNREQRHAVRILRQRRDIAYLLFDIGSLVADIDVTEAQIENHYGQYLDDYMTEERFDFDYVRLPRSRLEGEIEIDDETVQLAYEDEVATMPEPRRHVAHILLEVGAERSVDDAVSALRRTRDDILGGASFEELAAELSEDPTAGNGGDLGLVGAGVLPPAFEDVLSSLEPGSVSEPVQTEFGVHLIKLVDVETVEVPTLEERRDAITADLRRAEADRRFAEAEREIDEIAFEEGDSLDALTAIHGGLAIERLDGVMRNGRDGVLSDAAVHDVAFSDEVLVEGFNSRAVATPNEIVVIRLRDRHPSVEKPLDEVRDAVRDAVARERARALVEEAAFNALARFADGATPAEIADETGVDWQRADSMTRDAADVPQAILTLAFEMTAPSPGERQSDIAILADGSRALVLLSGVTLGDYGALTEDERNFMAQSLEQLRASQDLGAVVRSLRTEASINMIEFDSTP
ncbi:MAG: hypothetical protein F4X98_08255 [Gammaproteobacteria bacterium]|nr:hypothetical protein [Gammaproteobacteria bacterium]